MGKKKVAEQKKKDRESAIRNKEEKKELAIIKTNEAQEAISELESILLHTLAVDETIEWDSLLKRQSQKE